jgi:hypothetical protein
MPAFSHVFCGVFLDQVDQHVGIITVLIDGQGIHLLELAAAFLAAVDVRDVAGQVVGKRRSRISFQIRPSLHRPVNEAFFQVRIVDAS